MRKQIFISNSAQTPRNLSKFFVNFGISKVSNSLLKLIFRATEFRQILKFQIFQESMLYTSMSIGNLELKVFPSAVGQYL